MDSLALLFLIAVPFAGLLVLFLVLRRWGRKRDPMSGSVNDRWRTTGTTTRYRNDSEKYTR